MNQQLPLFGDNYNKNWRHWANQNVYGQCFIDCKVCYGSPVKQENDRSIYAARPEDEMEIEFVLWKLLNGVSFIEKEAVR